MRKRAIEPKLELFLNRGRGNPQTYKTDRPLRHRNSRLLHMSAYKKAINRFARQLDSLPFQQRCSACFKYV